MQRFPLCSVRYDLRHLSAAYGRSCGFIAATMLFGLLAVALLTFGILVFLMLAQPWAEERPGERSAVATDRARLLAAFEAGEDRPGGALTALSADARTLARFPVAMAGGIGADFAAGGAVFRKIWVSAPASTSSSSGLGPLYNARSCEQCHPQAGRGLAPRSQRLGVPHPALVLRLSVPPRTEAERVLLATHRATVIGEPVYGVQLQTTAIQGHAREGQLAVTYAAQTIVLGDGEKVELRAPTYRVAAPGYEPFDPATLVSPRLAPQLLGLGLLEAIASDDILSWADRRDRTGEGISGRANTVWSVEAGKATLGRFGWKAGSPTLRQQAAEAFAVDMGLSNAIVPKPSGDCTVAQALCLGAPNGQAATPGYPGKPHEVADVLLDLVTTYLRQLAVPARPDARQPDVLHGKALFHDIGCAACHRPSFTTSADARLPELSAQRIWPYSDLLLHDMGEGLADHRPEGDADGRSWRTAPLWGLSMTLTAGDRASFLHDGRAGDIQEAILWHAGAALKARDAYAALSRADRQALLKFVKSL